MTQSPFNPHEQRLIDQLRQSPAPELNPEAVERLRQRVFDEVDLLWPDAPSDTPSAPAPRSLRRWPLLLAALIMLVIIILLALMSRPGEAPLADATPTATLTLTATPRPAATATPLDEQTLIVVEGPVQQIGDDFIIIFDQVIEIELVRELVGQISIGMVVRVEGESRFEAGRFIIRATQMTTIAPPESRPPQQPGQQGPPPPPGGGRGSRSSRSS
jgi:hypothetical protein